MHHTSIHVCFFPNSVSLGSSAIVKVPEQVGAAKILLRKVPRFPGRVSQARFPGRGSQARFPGRGSQEEVPRKRFPSKVPRNRFPGTGSQEQVPKQEVPKQEVPKQGFRSRFPSKVPSQVSNLGSQVRSQSKVSEQVSQSRKAPGNRLPSMVPKVPSKRFPARGSQARFPGTGSGRFPKILQGSQEQVTKNRFPRAGVLRNRFPSQVAKVPRKRFPSQVSKQGSQEHIPKWGYQARVRKQSSQEQICKQGVQAQVSKQSLCCSRQMVNKRFISVYLKKLSNIIPTNFCWLFHVVVAVGDILRASFFYVAQPQL